MWLPQRPADLLDSCLHRISRSGPSPSARTLAEGSPRGVQRSKRPCRWVHPWEGQSRHDYNPTGSGHDPRSPIRGPSTGLRCSSSPPPRPTPHRTQSSSSTFRRLAVRSRRAKGSPMHAPAMTVTLDSLEVGEVSPELERGRSSRLSSAPATPTSMPHSGGTVVRGRWRYFETPGSHQTPAQSWPGSRG